MYICLGISMGKSVNTDICSFRMFHSSCAFKSLSIIERNHAIDCNSCSPIISCYGPTNSNHHTDITTFNNELPFLILKHLVPCIE